MQPDVAASSAPLLSVLSPGALSGAAAPVAPSVLAEQALAEANRLAQVAQMQAMQFAMQFAPYAQNMFGAMPHPYPMHPFPTTMHSVIERPSATTPVASSASMSSTPSPKRTHHGASRSNASVSRRSPPAATEHSSGEPKRKGKWSSEQDALLKETVAQHSAKNWKKIAQAAFGHDKSDVQCLHRSVRTEGEQIAGCFIVLAYKAFSLQNAHSFCVLVASLLVLAAGRRCWILAW
jgi:hypothetical protein